MAIPRSWRSKMRRPARCTRSRSTDRRRATGWRYSTATQASCRPTPMKTTTRVTPRTDRKSTRLNSSHGYISYAVFCLKKKKKMQLYFRLAKKSEGTLEYATYHILQVRQAFDVSKTTTLHGYRGGDLVRAVKQPFA